MPPPADPSREEQIDAAELEAAVVQRGLTSRERAALARRLSPRWTFFGVAVLGLLGLTIWLRYTAVIPAAAAPEPQPNSIAVLPLVNASPDTANEYFSDGMTEELITVLGRVPGLRVAAASSAFALKGRSEDARVAGRRLNVGAVLEGSVRQANGRLRVSVHLVSVSHGFDLWSETYERSPADIFAVQGEIARAVVGTLRIPGSGSVPALPAPTASLEAHTAYLKARHAFGRLGAVDPARAAALFEEAIRLDSTFAPAWAGLASAHAQRAIVQGARPADAMPPARAAAVRALALDSTLADGYTTLGLVQLLYDWDWKGADSAFQRAIMLNPSRPEAHHWYAHLLLALGRGDEALAHGQRALALAPLDPETIAHLGWHHLLGRRYDDARAAFARALAVNPSSATTRAQLGLLAELQGDYDLAEAHYRRALETSPDDVELLAPLGRTHALDGRPEDAQAVLARLDSLSAERYVSPYHLASIADALGDHRRAFAWLEEAVADRAGQLVYCKVDPRLDRLRVDRRFARIQRRVGLP